MGISQLDQYPISLNDSSFTSNWDRNKIHWTTIIQSDPRAHKHIPQIFQKLVKPPQQCCKHYFNINRTVTFQVALHLLSISFKCCPVNPFPWFMSLYACELTNTLRYDGLWLLMELKGQFSQELMTVCDSQRANMAKKRKQRNVWKRLSVWMVSHWVAVIQRNLSRTEQRGVLFGQKLYSFCLFLRYTCKKFHRNLIIFTFFLLSD